MNDNFSFLPYFFSNNFEFLNASITIVSLNTKSAMSNYLVKKYNLLVLYFPTKNIIEKKKFIFNDFLFLINFN